MQYRRGETLQSDLNYVKILKVTLSGGTNESLMQTEQPPVTTLRDVWEDRGMTMTEVAAGAHTTVQTLYKMLRKEKVRERLIRNVCNVLRITRDQYDQLQPER